MTNQISSYLWELGTRKGDKVCVVLGNSCWYNLITHGIQRLGSIAVLVNTGLLPQDVAYIIRDSNSSLIITDGEKRHLTDLGVENCPNIPRIFCEDIRSSVDGTKSQPMRRNHGFPEDGALVLYTSGTTGFSKGALLTHLNITYNAEVMANHNGLLRKRGLNIQPPFYTDGQILMMISTLAAGGAIVQPRDFVIEDFWELIAKYQVQFSAVMPTNISMLVNSGPKEVGEETRSLEFILCSAAPLSIRLQEEFESKFHIPIVEGYGLTEAGSYSTCNLPPRKNEFKPGKSDEYRLIGSVGTAIGNEMKVVKPGTEIELPPGEVGEIIIRGSNVMKEYLNDPHATEKTIRRGWLYTGDLGCVDDRGFYFVRGRKRDLITHGGQKVFARDVEDVLHGNPKVKQVAVVSVRDETWGENVKAVVVLRHNCNATAEELIDYCRTHLARWKCPEIVEFVSRIPTSSSGKILKRLLT